MASPETDVEDIAALVGRLGEQGDAIVRDSVNSRSDPGEALALLKALLLVDTNKHLRFAIESMARFQDAGGALVDFLRGRLDRRSRDIVAGMVRSTSGRVRILACSILQLVCDDSECLETAKTLMAEAGTDLEATAAFLLLLGDAAYYTRDVSAVDLVRPYATHANRGFRVPALLALRAIPGKGAEAELRAIAESIEDEFSGTAAGFLATREEDQSEESRRKPPGWRQEAESSKKP